MQTEREKDRGEYWEEPTSWELNIVSVWGFIKTVKEKIKDLIYELSK